MSDLGRRILQFTDGHRADLADDEIFALGVAAGVADRLHGQGWDMGAVFRSAAGQFSWQCALCPRLVVDHQHLDAVAAIMVGHMFSEHWQQYAPTYSTEGEA